MLLGDKLFRDIDCDQAGTIAGPLGILLLACLISMPDPGERVHGSAPDIASQGIANPVGTVLSVALMCETSFARPNMARRIEAAVAGTLEVGHRAPDIGGDATTAAVTEAVVACLRTRQGHA